jgi:hypothetical protein
MREIRTSGLMSGGGKRGGASVSVLAPVLDSTSPFESERRRGRNGDYLQMEQTEVKIVIDLVCRRTIPVPASRFTELFGPVNTHCFQPEAPANVNPKIRQPCICGLTAQVGPDLFVKTLPGVAGSHRNPHLPNRHPNLRANL